MMFYGPQLFKDEPRYWPCVTFKARLGVCKELHNAEDHYFRMRTSRRECVCSDVYHKVGT